MLVDALQGHTYIALLVRKVIAGKEKGTIGIITEVMTRNGKCIVEGVNIKTKHVSPRNDNEKGSIKKQEYGIHHSNVMLYSTAQKIASRVGHKITEEGKKVREVTSSSGKNCCHSFASHCLILGCQIGGPGRIGCADLEFALHDDVQVRYLIKTGELLL